MRSLDGEHPFSLGADLGDVSTTPPAIPVMESVATFPESFYSSPKSMAAAIRGVAAPGAKILVQGGGPPIVGSSLITGELASYITYELSDYAQRNGLKIKVGAGEWGHACIPIDHTGDPPEGMDPRVFRKLHIQEGAQVYFGTLETWMDDKDPDSIDVWIASLTLNAGLLLGRKELGLPRAYSEMQQVATKTGRFSNKKFEDFWFSNQASPPVEAHNVSERVAILAKKPGPERDNYLRSIGKELIRTPGTKVLPYGLGVGSKDNKDEIDAEIDQAVIALREMDLLKLPDDLKWRFRTASDLRERWLRSLIITRAYNPFVFDSLGIPVERTAHFYNEQIKPKVFIYQDVEAYNPLIRYNSVLYKPYLEEVD